MATVGAVWINVLPSMQGFARNLGRQATSAAQVAAVRSGTAMGTTMADSTAGAMAKRMRAQSARMQATFAGSTNVMTRSLANFRAGFASADAAASAFTGRMGRLGGATSRAVAPALGAVGRFAGGFRDAQVAASAFSGRIGTLGGIANRVLMPGVQAVGRFRDGFTDSSAAASAFSGRMGTLGGIARTALQPGITAARSIGTTMVSAGGMASGALGRIRAGASTAFTAVRGGLSNMINQARSGESGVGGVGSALASMGAVGAAAVSAIGLGTLGSGALRVAADIQQAQASMSGLYGSTQLAEDMMRRLRDYSRSTPLETQSLYEAGSNLAYLGLQGNDAMGVIENVGTALMASGNTSKSAMGNVTNALLSMQSAGQLYAADIQRVSNEMVPAWDMLASHMGMSIADVRKEVTAGNLTVDDFVAALSAGDGDYFQMMRGSAEQTNKTFKAQFAMVKDNVIQTFGETMLPLLDKAAPAVGRFGDAIQGGLNAIPGIMTSVGNTFRSAGIVDGFMNLVAGAKEFGVAAMPALRSFGSVIGTAFVGALKVMSPVGDLLKSMAGWMRDNEGFVKLLGAALGGAVTAFMAIRVATMAWSAAQVVLNIALSANPIGLIVIAIAALVAGIVYAYKNFEGFRNVVDTVWQAVKTAALWIWDNGLKPAFEGIAAGAKLVGQGVMWLWTTAVQPVFAMIGALATWLWNNAIKPAFALWTAYIRNIVVPALLWLWNTIIKPVFQMIGAAISFAWNSIIKPVWNALRNYIFGPLATGFMWLWNTIIKPVWNGIQIAIRVAWAVIKVIWAALRAYIIGPLASVFKLLWNGIVKPIWNGIQVTIRVAWFTIRAIWDALRRYVLGPLGGVFKTLWNGIVKPAWNGIKSLISNAWNGTIKPVFRTLRDGVKAVWESFRTAKKHIKTAWNGIRDSAKTPVNFLIGTVYNKGIRDIWNKVAGIVGGKKIAKAKTFASGGVLPGYSPGRDIHQFYSPTGGRLALSGGEAIMRPEVTRALGTAGVERINRAARSRGVGGVRDTMGFARGGVWGAPSSFARGGWLGVKDIAPDSGGFIKAVGKFLKDIAADVFTGDLGGAVDKVFKPAKDVTRKFGTKGFPGTPFQMVGKFNKSLKDKIESFASFFTDDGFSLSGVKGVARNVLKVARASVGRYPESGGNNTNAITRWFGMNGQPWCAMFISWLFAKANASGSLGRAAKVAHVDQYRGAMANVGQGNRRPGDVLVYGSQHVNLATSRYGTIGGNESNNVRMSGNYGRTPTYVYRPKWRQGAAGRGGDRAFASGGVYSARDVRRIAKQDPGDKRTPIQKALYDSGGFVQPGTTLISNRSGRPEPVLTSAQWRDMHRIAQAAEGRDGGELMRDAHVHLYESEATVREAFRSVDLELRKRRRGGVHAGRGA